VEQSSGSRAQSSEGIRERAPFLNIAAEMRSAEERSA